MRVTLPITYEGFFPPKLFITTSFPQPIALPPKFAYDPLQFFPGYMADMGSFKFSLILIKSANVIYRNIIIFKEPTMRKKILDMKGKLKIII